MTTENETLAVRPPWRDELPRLKAFIAEGLPESKPWRFLTLNASNPERIVGAVGLCIGKDSGELLLNLRPRVLHEKRGGPLLEAAVAAARELKLAQLITRTQAGASQERFLRDHGFEESRTEELWRLELVLLKSRVERLSKRRSSSDGWIVRTPTNEDVPQLAALFEAHRLVAAKQVWFRIGSESSHSGFDAGLSGVVEDSGRVLAGLVVQGSNGTVCHIVHLAVAMDVLNTSGRLLSLLLGHAVQNWLGQGYLTATFKVDVARNPETRNLARRAGGVLLNRVRWLVREL